MRLSFVRVLIIGGFAAMAYAAYQRADALDSCIEEVQTECRGILEYVSMLEAENARLNDLLKKYDTPCAP